MKTSTKNILFLFTTFTLLTCAQAGRQQDQREMIERLETLQQTIDAQSLLISSQATSIADLSHIVDVQTMMMERLVSEEDGPIVTTTNNGTLVCTWEEGEQP
jgi:hypothetical protein